MNNTGTLHLRVKDFSEEHARKSELLIRIGIGKLSYAIINSQQKSLEVLFDCVLFQSLPETFNRLLEQNNYLNYSFDRVKIASETFNFTFVPSEIYSQEALPVFKNFAKSSGTIKPAMNSISDTGIQVIASIEEQSINPFLTKYPEAKIYSQAEPLIEGALVPPANKKTLIIQFNSGSFELLLLSERNVIFYNIFSAPTTDDFNYFLLLTMGQFDLKKDEVAILIAGEIEKYSENYRRISKYFGNITFADSGQLFSHSDIFNLVPAHQFFSLLGLGICG